MKRACMLFLIGMLVLACGDRAAVPSPPVPVADVSAPARSDSVAVSAVRICGKRADDRPGMNCIPPLLAEPNRPACRGEGMDIDGKDIGGACCPGLSAVAATGPGGAGCTRIAPPSVQVCVRCGDGTCGAGENRCNCPKDCGAS